MKWAGAWESESANEWGEGQGAVVFCVFATKMGMEGRMNERMDGGGWWC